MIQNHFRFQIKFALSLIGLIVFSSCTERKPDGKQNKEIIQRDSSESASTLRIKAGTFYSKDEFDKASEMYGKLLELDSLDTVAIYRYAFCNAKLEKYSIAIKYWLKSAELKYRISDSYHSLGLLYFPIDKQKSVIYFNKCLELNRNDEEAKRFLYLINKDQNKSDI